MRVVLAGGGTAGHIEPALALADALRRMDPSVQVTCLGTERGLETTLIPQRGYELALIPPVPLPRTLTPRLLAVPGRLNGAINAAAAVLDRTGADILVGFGGYVATPGYLAARRRRIPIIVHEANPKPGLANKLGARFTEHSPLPHAKFVGIPIRRQIAELDRLAIGDKARSYFGLDADLPTLLIFGGSQGARDINRAAVAAAPAFRAAGVQVLHIVGKNNTEEAPPGRPGEAQYVTIPYCDRMDLAYAAADLAMCRAGAMTCAELSAVGLPAAYVPLPHGNGEQALNAQPIVEAGGGLMVENSALTPDWIVQNVIPILRDADTVARMSEAAGRMGHRDADVKLAQMVFEVVRGGRGGRQ
jgi:UDP-N-acetylglucosamine--N-acetylmuramyl-(pentapeptide) pyrophosphoryl-undecaprenol N-acetylglucosamine transferase